MHPQARAGDAGMRNTEAAPPARRRRVEQRPVPPGCVEEVVEIVEEQCILVRFPCFDFFRNVHLCERRKHEPPQIPPETATGQRKGRRGEASPTPSSLAGPSPHAARDATATPLSSSTGEAATVFSPQETFWFVPGTLSTSHPYLVLNPGAGAREMLFRGVWEPASAASTRDGRVHTNSVVVRLTTRPTVPCATASSPLKLDSPRMAGAATTEATALGAAATVQSLLPHAEDGLTADESRQRQREDEQATAWQYESILVPTAVLVMHRFQ